MLRNIKDQIPWICKEGYVPISIAVACTFIFFSISMTLGWLGVICTIFCVSFFRDPDRVTPVGDELVVSPADGVVLQIVNSPLPHELRETGKYGEEVEKEDKEEFTRVSIFLSVFDVHVNRIPVSGVVKASCYNAGRFFNASLDKASEHNERCSTWIISTYNAENVAVVQIAGLIARRIVCKVRSGQEVIAGRRLGMIKFGSRVDLYLPSYIIPQVLPGQRVIGGETIIADLSSVVAVNREGEIR